MLNKRLEDITEADLQALIDDKRRESKTLDYKRDLNLKTPVDKNKFLANISAFANATGGFLIFGIDEAGPLKNSPGVRAGAAGQKFAVRT